MEQYYQEYTQLQEEIEELELRIKDQNQRSAQIEQRLVEMRRMEKKSKNMHPVFDRQYIMQGSILSVHVIDARDLKPSNGPAANARVRLSIEGNRSSTQEIPGSNNPVWNEVSAFDILEGTDKLTVQVQDVQPNRERTLIGEVEIDLRDLSHDYQRWIEMNDEGKYWLTRYDYLYHDSVCKCFRFCRITLEDASGRI